MDRWAELCWNWRHAVRMTQAEAAEALGVSLSTYRRWEGHMGVPPRWRADEAMDRMILEYRSIPPHWASTSDPLMSMARDVLAEMGQ
jgi:transcriptional regulator with XRE-family HTH domain